MEQRKRVTSHTLAIDLKNFIVDIICAYCSIQCQSGANGTNEGPQDAKKVQNLHSPPTISNFRHVTNTKNLKKGASNTPDTLNNTTSCCLYFLRTHERKMLRNRQIIPEKYKRVLRSYLFSRKEAGENKYGPQLYYHRQKAAPRTFALKEVS